MFRDLEITDQARAIFRRAIQQAARLGHQSVCAAHVLMCISNKPPTLAGYILKELGVDIERLRASSESAIPELSRAQGLDSLDMIRDRARRWAERRNDPFVCTEHVLLAVLESLEPAVKCVFDRLGMELGVILRRAQTIADDMKKGTTPLKNGGSRGDGGN